jgi:hypothetical protein
MTRLIARSSRSLKAMELFDNDEPLRVLSDIPRLFPDLEVIAGIEVQSDEVRAGFYSVHRIFINCMAD